jgi:hypothetical protein
MRPDGPNKPGPSRTSPARIEARDKRQWALRLRRAGVHYEDIAERVGYRDRRSAQRAVERELEVHSAEDVSAVRKIEVERLDAMLMAMWRKAINGDGWSVDRVLRIMERRSRLLGLDAPIRQQIEVITESVLDEEIAKLTGKLAAREAEQNAAAAADIDSAGR